MEVRQAMEVCAADGQLLGTVERVDGTTFVADGRRLGFDAIERIDADRIYLWGQGQAYTADNSAAETVEQRERSRTLPNTDARLYDNRVADASMEERMPEGPTADGARRP